MESPTAEVIVVGGGPAGLTAAIALASSGIETVLVAGRAREGDHRTTSNRVCNPAYGAALRRGAGPSLRWMHFSSAGIERGIAMGLPEGLTITNSTGVKAGMVSEHAIALLLALLRRLPDIDAGQRGRRWLREEITARLATLE